jgi:hypothetical protein
MIYCNNQTLYIKTAQQLRNISTASTYPIRTTNKTAQPEGFIGWVSGFIPKE